MAKPIQPGEWQRDENGRLYRDIGRSMREYDMQINTTGGPMNYRDYTQLLPQIKENLRKQQQAAAEAEAADQPIRTGKDCPFKKLRNQMQVQCDSNCAMFDGEGCSMAAAMKKAPAETKGKYCPFSGRCSDICAFYNNGCTLSIKRPQAKGR